MDDIRQAVLAREDVVRYLRGGHGTTADQADRKVRTYLEELHTTQRYRLYRALKIPVYPILRKIDRVVEHVEHAHAATASGCVMYASNHKSHTDYLVEPVVLDDHGVRPPIIAAGINLFGGPLGFLHKHVSGALPIRRNTKDPAYLITLKAYVAELLKRHDLMVYPEGGRSYSGELKAPKTGLIHAALQSGGDRLRVVPMAIAYDLVLEDHILARQGVKKEQRPFSRELTEMIRHSLGYRSRAFVTLGEPISVAEYDPESRRDVLDLAHRTMEVIGRLYKVTPTALVAAAMLPSVTRRELEARVEDMVSALRADGANLAVESGAQAVDEATRPLIARGVLTVEGERYGVRDAAVLRYYAQTIAHLLTPTTGRMT